jgi:hypothetical protein
MGDVIPTPALAIVIYAARIQAAVNGNEIAT